MKFVHPKTFLIGETRIVEDGMTEMLAHLGAADFKTNANTDAEKLIEVAGRMCYMSFKPGLNKNVTRVRSGNVPYIHNILSSRHGSVLEHAAVTFGLLDVSPVLTHELVRHRAGTGFSQQSGRYVRIDEISLYAGDGYNRAFAAGLITPEVHAQIDREAESLLERLEAFQRRVATLTDLDNMENFTLKKQITSQMRRLAPYGISTKIVFTANHRALRHIIDIRNNALHAEEEVAKVFYEIGSVMKDRYTALYQDMNSVEVDTDWGKEKVWQFKFEKV